MQHQLQERRFRRRLPKRGVLVAASFLNMYENPRSWRIGIFFLFIKKKKEPLPYQAGVVSPDI